MANAIISHSLLDKMINDVAEREGRGGTLNEALHVVAAIARAGLVVLPAEPSAAMLEAGAAAGGVPAATVRAIFDAVIRAAD